MLQILPRPVPQEGSCEEHAEPLEAYPVRALCCMDSQQAVDCYLMQQQPSEAHIHNGLAFASPCSPRPVAVGAVEEDLLMPVPNFEQVVPNTGPQSDSD